MIKKLFLSLMVCFMLGALGSCGKKKSESESESDTASPTPPPTTTTGVSEEGLEFEGVP